MKAKQLKRKEIQSNINDDIDKFITDFEDNIEEDELNRIFFGNDNTVKESEDEISKRVQSTNQNKCGVTTRTAVDPNSVPESKLTNKLNNLLKKPSERKSRKKNEVTKEEVAKELEKEIKPKKKPPKTKLKKPPKKKQSKPLSKKLVLEQQQRLSRLAIGEPTTNYEKDKRFSNALQHKQNVDEYIKNQKENSQIVEKTPKSPFPFLNTKVECKHIFDFHHFEGDMVSAVCKKCSSITKLPIGSWRKLVLNRAKEKRENDIRRQRSIRSNSR